MPRRNLASALRCPTTRSNRGSRIEDRGSRMGKAPCQLLPPSSTLLGVIPSVALGGAVAVLAALFPAVFGGLMIVLRRWMMLLSIASINSTLYFLHSWFGDSFYDKWWGGSFALWLLLTA